MRCCQIFSWTFLLLVLGGVDAWGRSSLREYTLAISADFQSQVTTKDDMLFLRRTDTDETVWAVNSSEAIGKTIDEISQCGFSEDGKQLYCLHKLETVIKKGKTWQDNEHIYAKEFVLAIYDVNGGKLRAAWTDDFEEKDDRQLGLREFAVALSDDGRTLAVGQKLQVRLYDAQRGRKLKTLKGHKSKGHTRVSGLVFSKDGQMLISTTDVKPEEKKSNSLIFWDIDKGKAIRTTEAYTKEGYYSGFPYSGAESIVLSSDGRTLAVAPLYDDISFWDVQSLVVDQKIETIPTDLPEAIAYDRKGNLLSVNENTVTVWDVENNKILKQVGYTKHELDKVQAVYPSEDGQKLLILAGDLYQYVIGIDLKNGLTYTPFAEHVFPVVAQMQFSDKAGNGLFEPGGQGKLLVAMENQGEEAQTFLPQVNLSSSLAPYLDIAQATDSLTLNPGEKKTIEFAVSASDTASNNSGTATVELHVNRRDFWLSSRSRSTSKHNVGSLPLRIFSEAILGIGAATFLDQSNNGQVEPLENVQVKVPIRNSGAKAAKSVYAQVELGEFVKSLDHRGRSIGELGPGESADFHFMIVADGRAKEVALNVKATAEGIDAVERSFNFPFGQAIQPVVPDPSVVQDQTPPTIVLSDPPSVRGIRRVADTVPHEVTVATLRVAGTAHDESGVQGVYVNGQSAPLQGDGRFAISVPLALGENAIHVVAEDVHGNRQTLDFTALRNSEELIEGTYHALIIGVNDYEDEGVTDLDHPISDAQQVAQVLRASYGFAEEHITLLENPDRRTIVNTLQKLRETVSERDNLFVFYAGHGFWDEGLKEGFWLPARASWDDRSEWLENSVISKYLGAIPSRHTLLVSDACFSGSIFKSRDAFADAEQSIKEIYKLPSRKAITSGAMKTVPDRSVFVQFFVERLAQNTERYLDAQQLFVSIKNPVINNSPLSQTPLYGVIHGAGDEGGDFVFVRRE